uniref:PDZ domain-containing protein n=1 Tax=Equus asinus TaxID=9793 RepID=A0A9L0I8L4_EQUAS
MFHLHVRRYYLTNCFNAHFSWYLPGDVLANINGVSTEGFTHKQVVDLIRSSGNLLTIETLNGTMILKRTELEAKLQVLKISSSSLEPEMPGSDL